ncbi:MAG: hypothetical protein WBW93_17845 [Steroidobacteraceae bacterium]
MKESNCCERFRGLMSDIDRRLGHIERIVTDAGCICAQHSSGLVVIDDGWSDKQKKLAEDAAAFVCPAHGGKMPEILTRLTPTDALL